MEGSTEHETAARHLWLDVLREAAKDNHFHGNGTDFAGAFRQFDNFYLWLCLHKYTPGMKVYRYSPIEPFSARNCELKAEPVYKSLAVQAAELAEYERIAGEPPRPGRIRYARRKFTNADGTDCAIDSETNRRLTSPQKNTRTRWTMRLKFICLFLAFFWPNAAFSAPPVLSSVEVYLNRVEPIRAQIEAILEEEGVPVYFLFLALAESGGDPLNISPAGAAGLWQLMPATARAYGITPADRFDVEKSTRAAARYIRHLLDVFHGDYLWTVAAYNAGGHNLRRATGYKEGMSFEVVKTIRPAAYALARTVQRMEARYGRKR